MQNAVTLSYKDQIIAELNRPGCITLLTAGKVCETDIELSYVSRSPRGAADAELNMENWERRYLPSGAAAEEED